VAIVAHDLREPVGLIQSLLGVLTESWESLPEDRRLEMVTRVERRSRSLSALVDDLFDLSLIEADRLVVDASPFRVDEVVEQVVEDAKVLAPDRSFAVEIDAVDAVGDEHRTWQILTNLVSNALKYSPAEHAVTIRVEQVDGEAMVSVEDKGGGMLLSDQDLAFAKFGRLPGDRETPGTGMGLFIARSLADAQGGRLWLESEAGHGSTFRLALPAAKT